MQGTLGTVKTLFQVNRVAFTYLVMAFVAAVMVETVWEDSVSRFIQIDIFLYIVVLLGFVDVIYKQAGKFVTRKRQKAKSLNTS